MTQPPHVTPHQLPEKGAQNYRSQNIARVSEEEFRVPLCKRIRDRIEEFNKQMRELREDIQGLVKTVSEVDEQLLIKWKKTLEINEILTKRLKH